jgi:hypothetical protein
MRRTMVLWLLVFSMSASVHGQQAAAQLPPPAEAPATPEKRSWLSRLNPFGRSEKLPEYKDPRLRGLVLSLELSPQPIKLSEVRQMDVRLRVTNKGRRPISLDFPNAQRIEILLRNSTEKVLTAWSDNHAFAQVAGTVLINPQESIEYAETIATRELTPNKVFIVEAFFPQYPELTIRQKFLTAP